MAAVPPLSIAGRKDNSVSESGVNLPAREDRKDRDILSAADLIEEVDSILEELEGTIDIQHALSTSTARTM